LDTATHGPGSAATAPRAAPPVRDGRGQPRHTFLELLALPGAVPCARKHAQCVVAEWGRGALADTVGLLVSELVTNAVTASQSLARDLGVTPVRLLLVEGTAGVLVQVWDASGGLPAPAALPEPLDAEHGRGLLLVDALSQAWGSYVSAGVGKVVWCSVEP
jgi:anti-sigma regulatory factor (Ser/Thr protein kinase)